jgi:FkbM family methyltransferase
MVLTSFYKIIPNLITYIPIIIIPTPYGILITPPISPRAQMLGIYETPASKILEKELKDARLFIDVGTHVGYYTLLASKIAKEIISIEPNPFNYKLLKFNLRINKIKNVYALNIAASNYNGETGIFIPKLKGKIATDESRLDNNISRIKIKVVKLDDLLLKIGKNPDVIKIDVEGSEMQVLEGLQEALRKGVKCLMIEVHSEENKAKAISFIKSLGYKTIQVSKFLICKH